MSFELINDLSFYDDGIIVTRASRSRIEPDIDIDQKVLQAQQTASPILREIVDEDWMKKGACNGLADGLMFPDNKDEYGIEKAKAVCRGCAVINVCLEDALANREQSGVRGGMSERERIREIKKRKMDRNKTIVA